MAKLKEIPKKLTSHDVAFGIGRVATDEEMKEYLNQPVGQFKDSKTVLKEIKSELNARVHGC